MTEYKVIGECGGEDIFDANSDQEAKEMMVQWMEGANFDSDETVWYSAILYKNNEEIWYKTIAIDPDEPKCEECEHDWKSPYSVVGGLKENPGVRGNGGGVIITEVCCHCGCYRITDTWAQNPSTGEQGLESVRYEEPDSMSAAYVKEQEEN